MSTTRLVANGATCTRCGAAVPVTLDGLGALSPESALEAIREQVAAHNNICPVPPPAPAPPAEVAHAG